MAVTGDDLINAALEFDKLRNQISDGTILPPGDYAALLHHFAYVSQNELALTLMLAGAGGGGSIPDPLQVAVLQATSQVQVPNGSTTALALQIGAGNYGLYRTGTSIVVGTGGIFPMTFGPANVTLAVPLNANNIQIQNLPDPTAAQNAANMRWCQASFAPASVLDAIQARLAGLEARLAAAERRLP